MKPACDVVEIGMEHEIVLPTLLIVSVAELCVVVIATD